MGKAEVAGTEPGQIGQAQACPPRPWARKAADVSTFVQG